MITAFLLYYKPFIPAECKPAGISEIISAVL